MSFWSGARPFFLFCFLFVLSFFFFCFLFFLLFSFFFFFFISLVPLSIPPLFFPPPLSPFFCFFFFRPFFFLVCPSWFAHESSSLNALSGRILRRLCSKLTLFLSRVMHRLLFHSTYYFLVILSPASPLPNFCIVAGASSFWEVLLSSCSVTCPPPLCTPILLSTFLFIFVMVFHYCHCLWPMICCLSGLFLLVSYLFIYLKYWLLSSLILFAILILYIYMIYIYRVFPL